MNRLEIYEDILLSEGTNEKTTDSLPSGVIGACVTVGGVSAIFLNKREINTNAKRLEILSHERCHLSEGALYKMSSSGREVYDAERRATIASYRELLPFDYVMDAIFVRRLSTNEIAIEEEVPLKFVEAAVTWYSDFEEFIKAKEETEYGDR
jgi:hypothetical protein